MSDQEQKTPAGAMSEKFTERPPEDELEQIESERAERLHAENRPPNTEVDNTQREFDSEAGKFTDADDYDPGEKPYDDSAGETGVRKHDDPGTESAEQPSSP